VSTGLGIDPNLKEDIMRYMLLYLIMSIKLVALGILASGIVFIAIWISDTIISLIIGFILAISAILFLCDRIKL